MAYKTPSVIDGDCELELQVQGSPEFIAILINHLNGLIYANQWTEYGTSILDCTEKIRAIIETVEIDCINVLVDDDGFILVDDDGFILIE
jgi:hypothetical protein